MVKGPLKTLLRRSGLWYSMQFWRQAPAVVRWLKRGCTSPPPHVVKLLTLRFYACAFNLRVFVETGTFLGESTEWMARAGLRCYSIELDPKLYAAATARLRRYSNVQLIHGDSAQVLPELLSDVITQPCLFWLDAHYSGEGTSRGPLGDSPIMFELEAILKHGITGHVVLIDDARLFAGRAGYPFLEELLNVVRTPGCYETEVSGDIIRVTPR